MISFFGHCCRYTVWHCWRSHQRFIDDFIADRRPYHNHVRVYNLISCHTFRVRSNNNNSVQHVLRKSELFVYTNNQMQNAARHRIVFPSRAIIIHVAAMLLHGNDSIKLCLPNVGRAHIPRKSREETKIPIDICLLFGECNN